MLGKIVEEYFSYLCPGVEDPIITTCWMQEIGEKKPVVGKGCVNCRVSEIASHWAEVGREKPSLHVTVCRANVSGRRRGEDIQGCRVFLVDLDRTIDREGLSELVQQCGMLPPHWIVESSPEKYHLYWRAAPETPLEVWSDVQIGLAWRLQGDYNLSVKTALIRVPGFVRVCKDGKRFLPHIIDSARAMPVLQVGQLQEGWPWLGEAIERGKAAQGEARRAASAMGRAIRSNWDQAVRLAGKASEGGRNTALYAALRSAVWEHGAETEVEQDLLRTMARELNGAFSEPLSESEVSSVLRSAVERGMAARARAREREEKNLEMLKEVKMDVQVAVAEQDVMPSETKIQNKELKGNGHDKVVVPEYLIAECVNDACRQLIKEICEGREEFKQALGLLVADLSDGDYADIAEWLCKKFRAKGVYNGGQPWLFVQGDNLAGEVVRYPQPLNTKEWDWLCLKILSGLGLLARGDEELKKILKKRVKSSVASRIAAMAWECGMAEPAKKRQDKGIIVFQNGILELERGVFVENWDAPLRYSNPLWCYWDKKVESTWHECSECGFEGYGSEENFVREECPVFWKYMQDWFPADWETVRILMCFFGYSMTTDNGRMKFLYLYGPSRSGKGSIARTFCGLVGSSNYSSSDYSALEEGFRMANMHGKLLVTLEETEAGWADTERRMARLKKLVGGERVTFERKYCDPIEDEFIAKIVMQSNEAPQYQDKGRALATRMVCIGTEHSFEEGNARPSEEILKVEMGKLATATALLWSRHWQDNDPFTSEKSRGLEVGFVEVKERLDIVGHSMGKYLSERVDSKNQVATKDCVNVIGHVNEKEGIEMKKPLEKLIAEAIRMKFPQAKRITRVHGKQMAGYSGLAFNLEAIRRDFPELLDGSMKGDLRYQNLIEALEQQQEEENKSRNKKADPSKIETETESKN